VFIVRYIRAAPFLLMIIAGLTSACANGPDKPPSLIVYEAGDGTATNVYTVDAGSGSRRQLTFGSSLDANPAWSPSREQIVFVSDREGPPDIYLMDSDGENVVRLTNTAETEIAPKFSPDGGKIAFARQDGEDWTLRWIDADGTDDEQLAGPYRFVEFPSWHPDGKEIFFAAIELMGRSADIFGIELDTRAVSKRIATEGRDVCPHFSHDARWLTYATESGDQGEMDVYRHDLSSTDTTGEADVRLTDSPGVDDYANYSSDDRELVFVARRDGEQDLYLMDADGTNQRRLTNTPGVRENVPDW
jgi:Tol biopolymer transport system component